MKTPMCCLLSTSHHQVCEPQLCVNFPVKPAMQSEGLAVRVPIHVYNVTALQHHRGQGQSSVLARSLHKHIC